MTEFSFRARDRGDVHIDRAVDVLTRGILSYFAPSLTQPTAGFGDGWRRALLLGIDCREALDHVVLRVVPGLVALLQLDEPVQGVATSCRRCWVCQVLGALMVTSSFAVP
ncbi:hypothetical protein OM788_006213 [Streptomyces sp. KA12]|uniref:hypothetical protein n=1 Tax=Streptomyces sp. KA12 TaxID=2991730 RepID=UPI0023B03DB3|nr:hypothetical protein [Streptomyces sp. KA12]MDF0376238.1 hypothetical protein [Streptomyces sp. KA12]